MKSVYKPEQNQNKLSNGMKVIRLVVAACFVMFGYFLVTRMISEIRAEHELRLSREVAKKTISTNTQRKVMVERALDIDPYLPDALYDRALIKVEEAKNRFRKGQSNLIDEEGLLEALDSINESLLAFKYKPRVYRLRGELNLMLTAFYASKDDIETARRFQLEGYQDLVTAARQLPVPRNRGWDLNTSVAIAAQAVEEEHIAAEFLDKAERAGERWVINEQNLFQKNSRTWYATGVLPLQLLEFQEGVFVDPNDKFSLDGLYIMASQFGMIEPSLRVLQALEEEGKLTEYGRQYVDALHALQGAVAPSVEEASPEVDDLDLRMDNALTSPSLKL